MNKKQPKLKFEEDKERTATRSPPKKEKVEQTQPRKKLKLDADKAAEKAQHLRFGKAEITPDEASRMTKAQKREMYASAIAGLRLTGKLTSMRMIMSARRLSTRD